MTSDNTKKDRTGQEGAPESHPQTGAGHDEQGVTAPPGGADRDVEKNAEAESTEDLNPQRGRTVPGHGQSTDVHHGTGAQGDRRGR